MNRTISHWGLGLAFVASCGVADTTAERIEVTQPNALGVESLAIEHLGSSDTPVFLLHAYAAHDVEVASVRLTSGVMPELSKSLPGDTDRGSELVVSVQGIDSRSITRSTDRIELGVEAIRVPAIVDFLELSAVSTALANEANVFVSGQSGTEGAYGGGGGSAFVGNCDPTQMLTRPVEQCCEYSNGTLTVHTTTHVNPNGSTAGGQSISQRSKATTTLACRGYNGATCSGASCYFGPFAYTRPVQTQPPAGWYGYVYQGSGPTCAATHVSSPPIPQFANVTGTQSTGAGCCGNGSGPCDGPFQSCSSCAGGNSGQGQWDY